MTDPKLGNPDDARASNSPDKFDRDFKGGESLDEALDTIPAPPPPDGAAAAPLSAVDRRAAWDGEYHPGNVVLHIEYITDGNARLAVWTLRAFMTLALLLLVLNVVWKFARDANSLIRDNRLLIFNVVVASCCVLALSVVGGLFGYRVVHFARAGISWTPRRKRLMIMTGVELVFQMLAAVFFLAPNAYAIAVPCGYFLNQVNWMG